MKQCNFVADTDVITAASNTSCSIRKVNIRSSTSEKYTLPPPAPTRRRSDQDIDPYHKPKCTQLSYYGSFHPQHTVARPYMSDSPVRKAKSSLPSSSNGTGSTVSINCTS